MDAWWTAQQAGLIGGLGGTGIGILGAAIGTVGGICAPRGKCKALVFSLFALGLGIGIVSLAAGIVAVIASQPYHVFYPLLLGGIVSTIVFGILLPVFIARYREADMRRLEAETLRRS